MLPLSHPSGGEGWGEGAARLQMDAIQNETDYRRAIAEVRHLWGASSGTPDGDRLDRLATLIDAYESVHDPMDPPKSAEAEKFRLEQQR